MMAIFHDQHPLVLFSPTHWAAVAALALSAGAPVTAARRWTGRWTVWVARALAILLVVNEVAWWTVIVIRGEWG